MCHESRKSPIQVLDLRILPVRPQRIWHVGIVQRRHRWPSSAPSGALSAVAGQAARCLLLDGAMGGTRDSAMHNLSGRNLYRLGRSLGQPLRWHFARFRFHSRTHRISPPDICCRAFWPGGDTSDRRSPGRGRTRQRRTRFAAKCLRRITSAESYRGDGCKSEEHPRGKS